MKKNSFDNRLQNDLFPDMPASFERGLKKTMEQAGVKPGRRLAATGIFTGIISVATVAACLVLVLLGVMGRSKSKANAASPNRNDQTIQTGQPTEIPADWKGITKVIALSSGFDFANQEKYMALEKGILAFLKDNGETEPAELWMCAIKSRFISEDSGYREDDYLDGYYVLAQHSFGSMEGPELYCLTEEGQVLWATEGSAQGPNHAVHPVDDSYAEIIQRHFLYGTEPMIAEPGIPHVKRGAVVGKEPGTDIEFSMAASITDVQNRLAAAGSAFPGAAREYFLVTIPAGSWDDIMQLHTLRFETEEGPVDVDMETELPLVQTILPQHVDADGKTVREVQYGVEHWLAEDQPLIRDLTDDQYGSEAVQQYAEAVRRALLVSSEHIARELWICGIAGNGVYENGITPASVYVLAMNVGDAEPSPELFYYENGRVLWMTKGADGERINVIYHNGNTIVFGKSPAFENSPLAMTSGKLMLENGDDVLIPVLPLAKIRERITDGPHYYSARECYLWKDAEEHQIKKLTIDAEVGGRSKAFTLDKVNILIPQTVPAMAVESDGTRYPGRITHMGTVLTKDGLTGDGPPLEETIRNGLLFKTTYAWQRPLTIVTASDVVTVDTVDVYCVTAGNNADRVPEQVEMICSNRDLTVINELPAGVYYLCFHTTVLGPYSETIGRYTFQTDYTVFKVTLR